MSSAAGTGEGAGPSGAVRIERLRIAHLTEIMPVERASYVTPWSVAMFVLELTRTEGIALGIPLGPLALLIAVEMVPDIIRTLGNVTMDVAVTSVVDRRTASES